MMSLIRCTIVLLIIFYSWQYIYTCRVLIFILCMVIDHRNIKCEILSITLFICSFKHAHGNFEWEKKLRIRIKEYTQREYLNWVLTINHYDHFLPLAMHSVSLLTDSRGSCTCSLSISGKNPAERESRYKLNSLFHS